MLFWPDIRVSNPSYIIHGFSSHFVIGNSFISEETYLKSRARSHYPYPRDTINDTPRPNCYTTTSLTTLPIPAAQTSLNKHPDNLTYPNHPSMTYLATYHPFLSHPSPIYLPSLKLQHISSSKPTINNNKYCIPPNSSYKPSKV